ncbi:nucleotide-diphospho-sugar transferase [Flavobacterium johnsoniae]|jgi:hypothetical protein|uniref:nucleotide-diphospho-sugar transferase n=1 Tax=Flavobacterium TaxID=237 RepID=UPI0032020029
MFETPILFLIFNRIDTASRVFEEIKKQKPKFLYIAADGARKHIDGEYEKCRKTREIIINNIDWDCEVKTLFRDENFGCGLAVSEAITWFFENVEQGIILEDDCLPHFSFFKYCEELLNKYKENESVFAIGGSNLQGGKQIGNASYFFSQYAYIWGWATWKRSWDLYDFELKKLDEFKNNKIINKVDNRAVFSDYWISIFEQVKNKKIDTWDYQWNFCVWNNQGVTIVPNVNLISNIGFGEDATHTIEESPFDSMKTNEIAEIIHPRKIKFNKNADKYITRTAYKIRENKKYNLKSLIKSIILWGKKKFA